MRFSDNYYHSHNGFTLIESLTALSIVCAAAFLVLYLFLDPASKKDYSKTFTEVSIAANEVMGVISSMDLDAVDSLHKTEIEHSQVYKGVRVYVTSIPGPSGPEYYGKYLRTLNFIFSFKDQHNNTLSKEVTTVIYMPGYN